MARVGVHLLAPGWGQGVLQCEVFAGFWGSLDLRPKRQTVSCISPLLLVSGSSFLSWKIQMEQEPMAPAPFIPSSMLGMS